ncbi:MAG: hypothetical protein GX595_15445 [Lentisphaerae bacterium]|nr:hypothetical protein [Lentisphaerota bacterium]
MTGFVAGVARADITPPVGVDLCGYGSRPGPSTGVHDDLACTALYLSDGRCELMVLSCDLIGLHHDNVAALRRGITALTGVPSAQIMVACSHTHAGPATPCIRYLGETDPDYLDWLLKTLVVTAGRAREQARPARAGWARVPVRVGMNRRQALSGRVIIGNNDAGVTAPHLDLLAVDGLDGVPCARLFSHAAHAVALGGDNTLISADWPGVARRGIEADSPGARALFLQGCCGNINCRERGWEGCEAQGKAVAEAVRTALAEVRLVDRLELGAAVVPLELPLSDPPTVSAAAALVADCRQKLADLPADANRGFRWMAEGAVAWSEGLLRLAEQGVRGQTLPFEVQAFRMGGGAMVALPGEVFVEYGLAIAKASPFAPTLVAGYANGNVGYIPTAAAYAEGGYEVDNAIRYYGMTMPTVASEGLILEAAASALAALDRG